MFRKLKRKFTKSLIYFSAFVLVLNTMAFGAFLNPQIVQAEEPQMCSVDVDVILIMDVSGSMADGQAPSKCVWWQLDWVDPPGTNKWIEYCDDGNTDATDGCDSQEITNGEVTQVWCDTKDQSPHHPSTFTLATKSKIDSAKDAATSFLNNMGPNDQSGLVSFSDNAKLEKELNNNHPATQQIISDPNKLIPFGSTNIGDAIDFATQELETNNNSQAVKVIILLTDGMANKMTDSNTGEIVGPGYGKWQPAVDYAVQKAREAADENYKIFTIGLGSNSDIDEATLLSIANITGATYHHAPNGTDLSDIYTLISQEICQYGSISGCKYNDANNNGIIDQGEETINNWEVNLNNGSATTTQTVADGCYTFAGLTDHTYTVSEIIPDGWLQTYPPNGFYSITISGHNDVTGKDFANYLPICGNNILDTGETCDDGNLDDGDDCSAICETEIPEPTYQCNDGVDNDGDQLIDYPSDPGCDSATDDNETDQIPPAGIQPGDIVINEIMQNPDAVLDHRGEWFEFYNTTNHNINLENCTISDNGSDSHLINQVLNVGAGDYAVLGVNDSIFLNGGVVIDYKYSSSFGLTNDTDDKIILTCNSVEIDKVEYDDGVTFPDPVGKSMVLADFSFDNNIGTNWCESSTVWSGSAGDFGTPGAVNDSCGNTPPPTCDSSISGKKYNGNQENNIFLANWEIELYNSQDLGTPFVTTTTDINGEYIFEDLCVGSTYIIKEVQQQGWEQIWPTTPDDTFYTETITAELPNLTNRDFSNMQIGPQSGDVIINELMWMGSSISTADEWIELKNTTSNQINFSETPWSIYKNDALMVIIDTGILEPNKYFLISNNDKDHSFSAGESALNITPDLIDSSISLDSSAVQYKLYNTADDSGDLIDTADNGLGDPLAGEYNKSEGIYKSMSRKSPPGDGTQAESWCNAGTQTNWDAGATELGTPGAENVCEGATPPPEFGSLKICKYEDADGSATTTDDQIALADWVFQIFDNTATSTATTTDNGCVIINELIPGDYRVTENIIDNWYLLNNNLQNHSFNIVANQETTINFYNTQYSTISGYKYKDLDNNSTTTEYLENAVENWEINLFNSNSSTDLILLSTTTTNNLGYFEFTKLIPGNYLVTEQDGPTQEHGANIENWTALSPTSTNFILTSGTNTSTDFINYYEEQEGSTQSDSANTGGGGAPNHNGKVELSFEYPAEKDLNQTYIEKIVVSNKGNIVLTNGVLTLDLPQDKLHLLASEPDWYDYNPTNELAVWNIPAMMVGQELTFEIEVEPLVEGQAETLVYIVFDQDAVEDAMTENLILINGTGGAPKEPTNNNQQTTKATTTPQAPTGQTAGAGEEYEPSQEEEVAGEKTQEGKINGASASKNKTEKIFTANWWMWVIILILLLILIALYYFVLRNKDEL